VKVFEMEIQDSITRMRMRCGIEGMRQSIDPLTG
jgi:hypothetical protein